MYKLKYIIYYNWAMYLEFVVLKSFIKHLKSGKQNQNKETHGLRNLITSNSFD
jgi:midasin (ATPase involved in ribosome maturation)